MLESKQSAETQRLFSEIKKSLMNNSMPTQQSMAAGSGMAVAKTKKSNGTGNDYNNYDYESSEKKNDN